MAINQNIIKKRNQEFKSLNSAGKRVALAKDVIKQIEAGTIIPTSGRYVELSKKYYNLNNSCQVDKLIEEGSIECHCCGIGAMLLSHVRKTNNYTVKETRIGGNREKAEIRLKRIFGKKKLDYIENIFEGYINNYFYTKYRNHSERLIAMCKNIIKNKGELISPK